MPTYILSWKIIQVITFLEVSSVLLEERWLGADGAGDGHSAMEAVVKSKLTDILRSWGRH